jgi:lipopolysaccharide export system protein LptA
MFDSHKIDAFFNGEKPFDNENIEVKPKVSNWLRFVKLGFPCIAAMILGIMVVLPNIKQSVEISDNVTIPRKNEMEKLHIEETVFNSIDDKNRVSTVIADSVDEVSPASSSVQIKNPHGEIPSDNGNIKITSKDGFFDQDTNVLTLTSNVQAIVEDGSFVETAEAFYSFKKDFGWGKEKVSISGNWGNIISEGFEYYKADNVLILKGKHIITTKDGVLIAEEETKYFQNENKTVSLGNVQLKRDDNTLYADKIIAYFKGENDLDRIEAFGNVRVYTPKGKAMGDKGYYNPEKTIVELIGNVQLEQNGNIINGQKAETNLMTSISKIYGDVEKGGRITGTFYNKKEDK